MIVLVVAGIAVVAAAVAYALSRTDATAADPIDPSAESQAVTRAIRRRPALREFIAQRFDRTSAGGLLLTLAFAVVFGTALVVGLVLDMVDRNRGIARWDNSVARWGRDHVDTAGETFVRWVTWLGARPVVIAVLLLAALYDWARTRRAQAFLFVAIVGIGEMLINNGIKLIVERDRPDIFQVVRAHGYSFPSGHSSAAAAAWAAAALLLSRGRSRPVRALLAAAAALIAVTVATSRALLGVHWLTDVVAGLVLGWGWFLLVAIAFGGRRQRLGEPVSAAVPEMAQPDDSPQTSLQGSSR